MRIAKIILYDEPTVPEIQLVKLREFLIETLAIEIEIRKNFFSSNDNIFEKIAKTRIFDLKKPFKKNTPTDIDIPIEKQNTDALKGEVLYDGFELLRVVGEGIPVKENTINTLHIIFTTKLICTFDEDDFRYHARALVGANPVIISTTGMIEAPAKSKQYYLDLMTSSSQEDIENIKQNYKGQFLEYHDLRIFEITKGYLMQSIIYYETGDAFCEDKSCRLFNAHWQEELFHSQLENRKFCAKHLEILKKLKTNRT